LRKETGVVKGGNPPCIPKNRRVPGRYTPCFLKKKKKGAVGEGGGQRCVKGGLLSRDGKKTVKLWKWVLGGGPQKLGGGGRAKPTLEGGGH